MKSYKFKINGNEYDVAVNGIEGKNASVTVNGVDYTVELEDAAVTAPAKPAAPATAAISRPQPAAAATVRTVPAPAAAKPGSAVTSPMQGVIIDICVNTGDAVKRGQKIAVIETMKMENDILSETDGTVTGINAAKGDAVAEGAVIVTLG